MLYETRSSFDEVGTDYTYEQYYVYIVTFFLVLFGGVCDTEWINVNLFPIENYTPED